MSLEEASKILGVNESDDINYIKKTYRKLVREYHPDIIKSYVLLNHKWVQIFV